MNLKQYLNANKRFYKECYLVNEYQSIDDFIIKRVDRITNLILDNTLEYNKTLPEAKELITETIINTLKGVLKDEL